MCIRDRGTPQADERDVLVTLVEAYENKHYDFGPADPVEACLLYTSDAADDLPCVDLGGRRIIKKKQTTK